MTPARCDRCHDTVLEPSTFQVRVDVSSRPFEDETYVFCDVRCLMAWLAMWIPPVGFKAIYLPPLHCVADVVRLQQLLASGVSRNWVMEKK